jgi:hypothetical protein
MTIIEFLDDINRMLGKDLREELIRNHLDEFIDNIKSLNKEYARIKVTYDNIFRLIRNNASAHKNKDAIQLLHAYQQLPSEELSLVTHDIGRLESSNQITGCHGIKYP